eukprot:Pgem_evm3s19546
MEEGNHRTMAYSTWLQYRKLFFPGYRLTRTAEDVCNFCSSLLIKLENPELSESGRRKFKKQLEEHVKQAVSQRRFIKTIVSEYIQNVDSDSFKRLKADFFPDFPLEESDPSVDYDEDDLIETPIDLYYQDFGGGISAPSYRFRRPQADYYASNLIIQNFVIANAMGRKHKVYWYDERGQDKGADAMCSLRISHMLADRIVAWCRNAMACKNLYTPMQFVETCNKVHGLDNEFLGHRNNS